MSIAGTLLGNIGIRAKAQEFPIPTNGLQLWLDATNPDSYPGTGTTWSDLSGNGYDFTLNNAAAFVAASGSVPAHMNFESYIARYIVGGTLTDVPGSPAANGTMIVFSSILNSTANWRTLVRGAGADHHVIIQNGTNNLGMYDNVGAANFVDSNFDVTSIPNYTTDFNMLAWKISQSSPYYEFSVNTVRTAVGSITNANASFANGFSCVGAYHGGSATGTPSQFWGKIMTFIYYDRHLSDNELKKIYQHYKITADLTDSYADEIIFSDNVDYLVLAGGGGGGGVIDGGGGAGGYRTTWGTGADGSSGYSGGLSALESSISLTTQSYTITVGQGGEGGIGWNNTTAIRGHKGRTSSVIGNTWLGSLNIASDGGGSGHGYNSASHTDINGGSGGGGSYAVYTAGTATTGQGFAGGNGFSSNEAGGGGGAGSPGSTAIANVSGAGGAGLASTITGTSITRAGGGGGGSRDPRTPGNGGVGGGGGGGDDSLSPSNYVDGNAGNEAEHGRAQYGAGGGGAGYNGSSNAQIGGNGGSGIVIFRIPSSVTYNASQLASDVSNAVNCTATYSTAADGSGDHVITFTVTTEDPYDGVTANDGTCIWTPTKL